MSETIKYDFALANSVCQSLETAQEALESEISALRSQTDELGACWEDEAGLRFAAVLEAIALETDRVKSGIAAETEEIRDLTRRMYFAEEEAKRLATEKQG